MNCRMMNRAKTKEFATNNAFERAVLKRKISSIGYGFFAEPALRKLVLEGDDTAKKLNELLDTFLFRPKRVVFSSASLNPFINQLISTPTYIVEVEKDFLEPFFEIARDEFPGRVFFAPTEKERLRYGWPGTILLYPLLTKSPTSKDGAMPIEKLIVDLICSPRYFTLFSGEDVEQALHLLADGHEMNLRTIFAYAKRKKKEAIVFEKLKETLGSDYSEVLDAIQKKL